MDPEAYEEQRASLEDLFSKVLPPIRITHPGGTVPPPGLIKVQSPPGGLKKEEDRPGGPSSMEQKGLLNPLPPPPAKIEKKAVVYKAPAGSSGQTKSGGEHQHKSNSDEKQN